MLMPKKTKYRKSQRGNMRGRALRGARITQGEYGLIALDPCWIKSNQIEAARVAATRNMKRLGKLWLDIFPDKSYTKKPLETRMGKGKGNVEGWVAVVKAGRVLLEIGGVSEDVAKESLRLAAYKLPVATKIYKKADLDKEVDARLGLVVKTVEEDKVNEE